MERVRKKKMVAVLAFALLDQRWNGAFRPSRRGDRPHCGQGQRAHYSQSDWDEALRYEALLNGRALNQLTDDDRRAVLDRLIDQELLAEQMKSASFQHASESEAAARVARFAEAVSGSGER